jgi:hypothetical protein
MGISGYCFAAGGISGAWCELSKNGDVSGNPDLREGFLRISEKNVGNVPEYDRIKEEIVIDRLHSCYQKGIRGDVHCWKRIKQRHCGAILCTKKVVVLCKKLRWNTPTEVRRSLARVNNMVLNGELGAKEANSIFYSANLVLKALELERSEERNK